MAQRADQHGAGVVILQPAGISGEDTTLLDRIAKFEEAVILHFKHPNHAEVIMNFGEQTLNALLRHFLSLPRPGTTRASH